MYEHDNYTSTDEQTGRVMYLGVEVREEAEDDGACVERVRHDEGGAGQRLDGCVGVGLGPRVDVRPEL